MLNNTCLIFKPNIKLKYVGAWVVSVNKPQMAPPCANKFTINALDRINDFHGIGNCNNIEKNQKSQQNNNIKCLIKHVYIYVTGKVYNLGILYIIPTVYKMPFVYWAM
jgi:hypothetical protein